MVFPSNQDSSRVYGSAHVRNHCFKRTGGGGLFSSSRFKPRRVESSISYTAFAALFGIRVYSNAIFTIIYTTRRFKRKQRFMFNAGYSLLSFSLSRSLSFSLCTLAAQLSGASRNAFTVDCETCFITSRPIGS